MDSSDLCESNACCFICIHLATIPSLNFCPIAMLHFLLQRLSVDRTGIHIGTDVAISAYYFCIFRNIMHLYLAYNRCLIKNWSRNGSL